ncbi:MAG: hypothetical protein MJ056_04420 [Akkermansia sp.]|nr:hypothetical protein [Akkermansia sp.]
MIYPRNHAAEQARANRRLILAVFGTPLGEQALDVLEARFETDLPVFQGKAGAYDPLDAMRRDAHREVFLVIRRLMEQARREAREPQNEHDHEHE